MDMDSIKRELENGGFQLGRHDYIEPGNDYIEMQVVPYISDPKAWEQYSNDALYDAEKRLRKWLEEMASNSAYRSYKSRTFRFNQVFEILFGRKYEQKCDGRYSTMLSKLFRYYCSKTAKNSYDSETQKTKSKTSFTFSTARVKRPPYSLKLRLEWLLERGEMPSAANMKLPTDIPIGVARNALTEAHRAAQREAGRQRYNEYQRRIRAEHKAGKPVRDYNRRASAGGDAAENDR